MYAIGPLHFLAHKQLNVFIFILFKKKKFVLTEQISLRY